MLAWSNKKSAHDVFKASAVLFFAYFGFDVVSAMVEEIKNPSRHIPFGVMGSIVITTIIYRILAIILCLIQPYWDIDPNQRSTFHGKYVVFAGAFKGMASVLLVGVEGQGRYRTHIARTNMICHHCLSLSMPNPEHQLTPPRLAQSTPLKLSLLYKTGRSSKPPLHPHNISYSCTLSSRFSFAAALQSLSAQLPTVTSTLWPRAHTWLLHCP